MQQRLCAAILVFEAIAFGLATPVLLSLTDVSTTVALVLGVGLAVACLLVAGMLRRPGGYTLAWVLQAAAIAVGFLVHAMFFLGVLFLALYVTAYVLGAKIETERAEWERTGEYPGAG